MLNIAVCDDEPVMLNFIKDNVLKILNSCSTIASVSSYADGCKLLKAVESRQFDIILLDISMPNTSGFEIAEKIRDLSENTYIVFISSKNELIHESMNYLPFNFIVKDEPKKMLSELERIMKKLLRHFVQYKCISVNDTTLGTVRIPLYNIIYMKSRGHYLEYYVDGSDTEFLCSRESITEKSKELQGLYFMRIQKQYIINLSRIKRLDLFDECVVMANDETLPVSRNVKEKLTEEFNKYRRN